MRWFAKCALESGVLTRCEMFFGRSEEVGVPGCGVGFVCISWRFSSF